MGDDGPFNPYPWGPHGARRDHGGPPCHPADAGRPEGQLPSQPAPDLPTPAPSIPEIPYSARMPADQVFPFLKSSAGGDFGLNVVFVGVLWEVWVCLYPISALAGLLTLLYGMPFLRNVLPPSPLIGPGLYAVVLAFVAAAIVLWNVSRLEHVLARHNLYRILRHLVRLPLLGMGTVILLQKAQGLPYDPTPAGVTQFLKTPANLGIVLGVMVASHFILWNWKGAREWWHRRLAGAQLRKRGT
jgi:hypothetical protein